MSKNPKSVDTTKMVNIPKSLDTAQLETILEDIFKSNCKNKPNTTVPNLAKIDLKEIIRLIRTPTVNTKQSNYIKPPHNLISDNDPNRPLSSLDRTSLLLRVFSSIPLFQNNPRKITIRHFLSACNSIVSDLDCLITENEFKNMCLQRIAPNIRYTVVTTIEKFTGLEALQTLYHYLHVVFDNSLNKFQAIEGLILGNAKYGSVNEWFQGVEQLSKLAQIDDEATKITLFICNLKNYLDEAIFDKLLQFTYDKTMCINTLMKFIEIHKSKINHCFFHTNDKNKDRCTGIIAVSKEKYKSAKR